MSADAGPGRTGLIFDGQCVVPDLARAPSAVVFRGGRCGTRISDMDSATPSEIHAHVGNQDDSRREPGLERLADRGLDCDNDSVLVTGYPYQ